MKKRKNLAKAENAPTRDAFLVRTYNPSGEAVKRILKWCSEIKMDKKVMTDVWVSIDCTLERPSTTSEISKFRRKSGAKIYCGASHSDTDATKVSVKDQIVQAINNSSQYAHLVVGNDIFFHEYTEKDMLYVYPTLESLNKDQAYSKSRIKSQNRCSLAWGFHTEAINCWYQEIAKKNARQNYYRHIWVVEDDVGYSGNICKFISYYSNDGFNNADFITANLTHVDKLWHWKNTCSQAYNIKYPMPCRVKTKEHCQRISSTFLNCLHKLGKIDGCHAWSESYLPTICLVEGFSIRFLHKYHIGSVYEWDGRVSKRQWETICSSISNRPKDKLYHALKW